MNPSSVATLGQALAELEATIDAELLRDGALVEARPLRPIRLALEAAWRAFAEVARESEPPAPPRAPRSPS